MSEPDFIKELQEYRNIIVNRSKLEIEFWNDCITKIKSYTQQEAIEELIKAKKLYEKISVINSYIVNGIYRLPYIEKLQKLKR